MAGVWVVMPTYNEAPNLRSLVRELLTALALTGMEHRILIVDDGSPDGTGAIADGLASLHPAVAVLHRPRKEGLSRAYLAGFRRALDGGADLVVTMDADFSHDPYDVPRLIRAAGRGDVVIGSRYVRGGRVVGWHVARRVISRAGCAYARSVLGVPVRDLTGGFKCFRRPVVERFSDHGARPSGYSFQIEWTFQALQAGLRVVEVPIVFHERRAGDSKMQARMVLQALWRVPALRALSAARSPVPETRAPRARRFVRREPAPAESSFPAVTIAAEEPDSRS